MGIGARRRLIYMSRLPHNAFQYRNGVMMLYREGTPGIFPQVSVHELMRLKRTG